MKIRGFSFGFLVCSVSTAFIISVLAACNTSAGGVAVSTPRLIPASPAGQAITPQAIAVALAGKKVSFANSKGDYGYFLIRTVDHITPAYTPDIAVRADGSGIYDSELHGTVYGAGAPPFDTGTNGAAMRIWALRDGAIEVDIGGGYQTIVYGPSGLGD